jgi:hypothetical protein
MKAKDPLRLELKLAKVRWRNITSQGLEELHQLLLRHKLSVALGEIVYLSDHWYVTHAGLLRLAFRGKCRGIKTVLEERYSDPAANRWVFKAVVHKSHESKGFEGYGDADPSNVSVTVRGAELRIAETRAVNRALRKAYGIGHCSVEELGTSFGASVPPNQARPVHSEPINGSTNGQPRLRDQLCLLIRDHNLDPTLVKAYAADFCGTATLSGASRELVESFISHLSTAAKEDRDGLVCKLNSYAQSEAHS